MKRVLLFLASIMALVSCKGPSDVPYTELDHYYFKNGQDIPGNPKLDTEEAFASLFGMAPVMGESGKPTPIDFSKEFVIAVVCPVTEYHTELDPESLRMENGELVFTYTEAVGEKQSWSMQPILLVKVSRKYETETVRITIKRS
ncbi:MAG: hypothetical protein J6P46_00610 [Bacteroidales bacterium]|nr:hypothetical protein [Bacteroidales bacterium]